MNRRHRRAAEIVLEVPLDLHISDIPLPIAYGVYALSDGKLTALELLPLKVPDPRVAISASILTPSQVHLPAGPLQFVIYRRDLLNDAPDRVSVRAVAQVMRALTFGPGRQELVHQCRAFLGRSRQFLPNERRAGS